MVSQVSSTPEGVFAPKEQAGEAGGQARADGHGDAVTADGGGVNPREIVFYGEIVEEETGFEIVGTVKEEIETGEKFCGVFAE